MRKRRRIEDEEEEMEEGNMSVIRSDLPPGRQEHQELKEHTICLAYHTNSNDCFFETTDNGSIKPLDNSPGRRGGCGVLSRYRPRVGARSNTGRKVTRDT